MVWYTLYDKSADIVGSQDWNGTTIRQAISPSVYNIGAPETGTQIRITFKAGDFRAFSVNTVFSGHAAASGDPVDFDGTQVSIRSATNTSFVVPINTTLASDGATYAFDKTKPLVISAQVTFPGDTATSPITGSSSTLPGFTFSWISEGGGATNATVVGTYTNAAVFPKVEVFFTDPPGAPTCTLTMNSDQVSPSSGTTAKFFAQFNKGITGFTSADCDLSSSTVTWQGGSPSVSVIGQDFAFVISVTGMLTEGNVVMRIPAAAVTAIADGVANTASGDATIVWDPDIINAAGPNVREVTIVNRRILRFEVQDMPVGLGHYQTLSTPDTGSGTLPITNVTNNGKGLCRITCAGFTPPNPGAGNISITDMVASPVSNGAGGQRIRCTVHSTASFPTYIRISGATGTFEANSIDARSGWTVNIIDSTHFDLVSRTDQDSGLTVLATFTNTYTGNGFCNFSDSEHYRVAIHSVGGTTEANGAWPLLYAGGTQWDLLDSHFANTYTSGGTLVPIYTWFERPNPAKGGVLDYCNIVGRDAKHLRFQDRGPVNGTPYLNRDAAKVTANYSLTGGYTITNMYLKSKPYSCGWNAEVGLGFQTPTLSFRHYIYVELSTNLANGTYTILFPPTTNLPPKTFTYNDKTTRCCAIHVDQNGHRPGDPGKLGYLSQWIPDYNIHGGVDYSAVTAWHLIDDAGAIVASFGAPPVRATPTSIEGPSVSDGSAYFPQSPYALREGPAMKVSNITSATVATATVDSAALVSNGDLIAFSDMWHWDQGQGPGSPQIGHFGMWQVETDNDTTPLLYTVINKSGNTFQLGCVKGVFQSGVAIASGGSGYAVGNTISLANGVQFRVATVSGGAVTSVTIISNEEQAGFVPPSYVLRATATGKIEYPFTTPTNPRPQTSSSGGGSGATFNLTWADNPWDRTTYPGNFCAGSPNTTLTPYGTASSTTAMQFAQTATLNRGNLCYRVNILGNRAGTYVYGLDYNSYTTAGDYRIYIPNIGVSDPIHLADSKWWHACQTYIKAAYHLRSGCDIDGRFGYTRPTGMKPRPGYPIYKSYLPYALSNYAIEPTRISIKDIGGFAGQFSGGPYGPWLKTELATQYGSHQDAGDYDTRIDETCWGYWNILDAWEFLPAGARPAFYDMGTPSCLEAGMDPTVFATSNGLPSPIVEVMWGLEQYRLSQEPSGAISGGLNYGEGVVGFETSDNMAMSLYAWMPDHVESFLYAFVAAKLARQLNTLGYTTLGTTYQTSAIAAYDWATTIHTDQTARDAYYLPTKIRATWSDDLYHDAVNNLSFVNSLQNIASRARGNAAASLFRLTGTTAYKTYLDTRYSAAGNIDVRTSHGWWEYANSPSCPTATRDGCFAAYAAYAIDRFVVNVEAPDITYTIGQLRGIWPMNFGGANDWSFNMPTLRIGAQVFTSTPLADATKAMRCRRAMQWIAAHRQGANQLGLCLPKGLGVRHNEEATHLDSRNTGQALPAGITSEGWANNFPALPVFFGDSFISKVQHQQYDPLSLLDDPTVPYRELYPYDQLAWPRLEMFMEHFLAIEHAEYTTQQQVTPAIAATMHLAGFDGNAATEEEDDREVSTLTITSTLNPCNSGDDVGFSFTVTGASGTPTGTVTWSVFGFTFGPLPLTAGVFTFPPAEFTGAPGPHLVTATYSGDINYLSDSETLIQTINAPAAVADRFPLGLALRMRLRTSLLVMVLAGGATIGTPTNLVSALMSSPSYTTFILNDGFYTGGAINSTVLAGRSDLTIRAANQWGAKLGGIGLEAPNITLDGVEVTYPGTPINITAPGAKVLNCRVHNFGHTEFGIGIWVRKSGLTPSKRVIIRGNTITNWGDEIFAGGIAIGEAADVQDITAVVAEITDNTITDGPTAPGLLSGAIQSFHPCLISGNFIHTVSGQGIQIKTINSTIRNNECVNVLFDGALYQRFPAAGNNLWENNLVHDCDVGIDHFMGQNVTYRGNVIYNCDHFGRIKNQGDITNLVIENNTFWNSTGSSGGWFWDSTGGGFLMNTIVFQKNIWDTVTGAAIQVDPVVASAWTENNNIFWACGAVPSPLGTGSSVTNPLLTSPPTNFTATAPAATGKGATWPIPV